MAELKDTQRETFQLEAAEHFATPSIVTPEIFDLIVDDNNLNAEQCFEDLSILAFSRSREGSKIRTRYIGNDENKRTSFYLDATLREEMLRNVDDSRREIILTYLTKNLENLFEDRETTTHFEIAQEIVNLFELKSTLFDLRGIPHIETKKSYLDYLLALDNKEEDYWFNTLDNYDEDSCEEFEDYISMKIDNLKRYIEDDSMKVEKEEAIENIKRLITLDRMLALVKMIKNPKDSLHLTKNSKDTFSVYSYVKALAHKEGAESV